MKLEIKNKKLVIGVATAGAVLAIGVFMQSLGDSPVAMQSSSDASQVLDLDAITLTSAVAPLPQVALSVLPSTPEEDRVVPVAASVEEPVAEPVAEADPCDITMTSADAPGAMVDLVLNAPCLRNERFVMHHNGMMFSALTDQEGVANVVVPALSANAVFIASFASGEGSVVQHKVPDLSEFGRVVVQWRGDAGLGLHAREQGADYFSDGHIHAAANGRMVDLVTGQRGYLARFGHETGPDPLQAEVYTFPLGASLSGGDIALSVETEITADNCDMDVEAQTLEIGTDGRLRVQDVTLYMPGCDAVGDFLVLKNLVADMTLASN
ncbi:hypothetical protein [Primorskyibacter sp. S187A]|uniref:hypothetical protein n=1 Tax=Primorskyibacter sp. S187A TaxID=3415130 RepID=UPI003C7CD7AC